MKAYDNWDLSTDRANAARRLMIASGVQPTQISQVRGFADQQLKRPNQPTDPSNRRISVIVQHLVKDDKEVPTPFELPNGKTSIPGGQAS
jgi:chemotaxis protein MotB